MDIEQSNEARMSGRGDGGALVRVERRRHWSDEEKLAILKETTVPGAIVSAVARRQRWNRPALYLAQATAPRSDGRLRTYRTGSIIAVGQNSRSWADRGSRAVRPDGVG